MLEFMRLKSMLKTMSSMRGYLDTFTVNVLGYKSQVKIEKKKVDRWSFKC